MKYFLFLRTGVEAKCGVELRHTIRRFASRFFSEENGAQIVLTLGSLCLLCGVQDEQREAENK